MRKVVYLTEQPLDHRNYDRWGIENWIHRGWGVEIWDLTPVSYPAVWRTFVETGGLFKEFEYYFPITSFLTLVHKHAKLRKTDYFIDLTGCSLYSNFARIKFKLSGTVRVISAIGSIPEPKSDVLTTLYNKTKMAIRMGPFKLCKLITNRISSKLIRNLIRPGFNVVSGTKSLQVMEQAKEIINAHNLDYDIYLQLRNSINSVEYRYIVFIDQDYCFHNDFLYQYRKSPISPIKYFPAVSKALRKIAADLDISMLVAAHPRSTYFGRDLNYFDGIPVSYGSTAEMIRDCSVVLCHNSTAIQFAVLFEKPVIFITTDELNALSGASINIFASELGKTVFNIDKDITKVDWQKELIIDAKLYADYRRRYIKIDGSQDKPAWDIVIDHLEQANMGSYSVLASE